MSLVQSKVNLNYWVIISTGTFLISSDFLEILLSFKFPTGFKHVFLLAVILTATFFDKTTFRVISLTYRLSFLLFLFFLFNLFYLNFSYFNFILGGLFTFLFLIISILSYNLSVSKDYLIKIFDYFVYFFLIASFFSIFQAVMQGTTLRYARGLFREVGAMAAFINIATILSLVLFRIKSKSFYFYLSMFFTMFVLATILKKSIVTNLMIWVIYSLIFLSRKEKVRSLFLYFLILLFITPFIYSEILSNVTVNLDYYNEVGNEEHVRIGMYVASFRIANDYFPFGSGLGTFGSLPSIYNGYSELYYIYGVDRIGSNSYYDVLSGAHTLFDTFWPHIIAELGYIGSFLYVLIWFIPVFLSLKFLRYPNCQFVRALLFYNISISVMIFFEGFTLFTPEIPAFIFFHSGITGLVLNYVVSKYKFEKA